MRKILYAFLLTFTITNFAKAEMIGTFGSHMGDDIYEGYQFGVVQPLTEFDASAAFTSIDDGFFITIAAQKGMEVYTSTMAYGFFDINRFFWDSSASGRIKTQLGWGVGVTAGFFDPLFIDFKIKKFESYSERYTYLGVSYMF